MTLFCLFVLVLRERKRERERKRADEEEEESRQRKRKRVKKFDVVRFFAAAAAAKKAGGTVERHACSLSSKTRSLSLPPLRTRKMQRLTARGEIVPKLVDVVAVLLVRVGREARGGENSDEKEEGARHALGFDATALLLLAEEEDDEEEENRPPPPPPPPSSAPPTSPLRPILVSLPPRRGPFEHSPGSRMPIESTESASTERESPHMRQSLFLSKSGEGERGKNSTSKKKETRRRKKPSPCRRLGAEGTACQAPQTQTSMSGPGSLLSEGARAAGVRPGGACRRPFKVEFEFFFFFQRERGRGQREEN